VTVTDDEARLAREARALSALIVGREPAETIDRLSALADRLAAGELPGHGELALLERMRARYARELIELSRPEPW